MAESKWGKRFWIDLAERVGSVVVYGLVTVFSMANVLDHLNWVTLWPVVVLPAVQSLLKGLLANFKDPESGASLINHPPGPEVQEVHGKHEAL